MIAGTVICITGERLTQSNRYEPRGNVETSGLRSPGTAAESPPNVTDWLKHSEILSLCKGQPSNSKNAAAIYRVAFLFVRLTAVLPFETPILGQRNVIHLKKRLSTGFQLNEERLRHG